MVLNNTMPLPPPPSQQQQQQQQQQQNLPPSAPVGAGTTPPLPAAAPHYGAATTSVAAGGFPTIMTATQHQQTQLGAAVVAGHPGTVFAMGGPSFPIGGTTTTTMSLPTGAAASPAAQQQQHHLPAGSYHHHHHLAMARSHRTIPTMTTTTATGRTTSAPIDLTPEVLRNTSLRSGKWFPLEERYAALLIEQFEKGQVPGVDGGLTLRTFLSQKLHCAPMRISKKFAGKGLGKMMYLSRSLRSSRRQIPANEAIALYNRVTEAEQSFLRQTCPTPVAAAAHAHSMAPFSAAPFPMAVVPMMQPNQQIPHHIAAMGQQIAAPGVASHVLPLTSNPAVAVATTGAPVTAAAAVQQQLQQSLVHNNMAPTPASASGNATHAHHQLASSAANKARLQESYMNALKQLVPNGSTGNSTLPVAQQQQLLGDNNAAAAATTVPPSNGVTTVVPSLLSHPAVPNQLGSPTPSTDIPDLLAGFNKIAAQMLPPTATVPAVNPTAAAVAANGAPTQGSPPLKSTRSFDAVHRFDLVAQAEKRGAAATTTTSAAGVPGNIDLFSADSYSRFAQESALAASQHAAYDVSLSKMPHYPKTSDGAESYFDYEGIAKLVHAEVKARPKPPASSPSPPSSGGVSVSVKPSGAVAPKTTIGLAALASPSAAALMNHTQPNANLVSGSEGTNTETDFSLHGSTSDSAGSENSSNHDSDGLSDNSSSQHDSDDSKSEDSSAADRLSKRKLTPSSSGEDGDGEINSARKTQRMTR